MFLFYAFLPNSTFSGKLIWLRWKLTRPPVYSMTLFVGDYSTKRQWDVIVEGEKVIQIHPLPDPYNDGWFSQYSFTIEGVINAADDFCLGLRDCGGGDKDHFYMVFAYGGNAISVDNFKACETVEECLGE